jgi:SOS response regulatory protein OraA/RecX
VTVPPTTASPFAGETASQRNARRKAADYLSYSAFSRSGLIDQLKYEGFSQQDAAYGVDSLNADWNDQAAKKAQQYLDYTSFSRQGLIDQLMYEGFTRAQAEYGANAAGL